VTLLVDGKAIPMNSFTQEIMEKVVSGVAESRPGGRSPMEEDGRRGGAGRSGEM